MNYRETFLTDDLNRILSDRQTADYLDGIFSVIRTIVGYTTIVNDLTYSEIMKDTPDKNRLIDILNESDNKLSQLLSTITDAHQIVGKTHISDLTPKTVFDFSDETFKAFTKAKAVLEGIFTVNADIEPYIFSDTTRSDVEILITDMVYKVIMYEISPAVIDIKLAKTPDGKRAVLSVEGKSDGNALVIPAEGETESLMHLEAVKTIFVNKFCESCAGIGKDEEKETGLLLSLEMDIIPEWEMGQNLRLNSKMNFDFENKRFSPVTVALSKYSKHKTYKKAD
jgi:hypothetical protein